MDERSCEECRGRRARKTSRSWIAGGAEEDFTRKVQQIIDRRFAEHRAKEENWAVDPGHGEALRGSWTGSGGCGGSDKGC